MKALAMLVAAGLTAAPAAPAWGPVYDGPPPDRFKGEGVGVVFFLDDVGKLCGGLKNARVIACSWEQKDGTRIMVLPTPRSYVGYSPYSVIVEHELAHWRGWAGNHPL